MNKRIKTKIEKRDNINRHEEILNKISKYFKVKEKYFLDGYFLCDFGKNSVCHFKLKETPEWKFGIWLDEKDKFYIFGEHIELIDKFKPNRTYLSFKNNTYEFIEIVKKISQNPKLYFVDSLTYGDAIVDYHLVREQFEKEIKEIYNAFLNKDISIGLFPSTGNNELIFNIVSKLSKEKLNNLYEMDLDYYNLQKVAKETGIHEILNKANKKYQSLIPRWKDNNKKEVWFLLYPMEENIYNFGWFTVKDLIDWTENRGKVVKFKNY